MPFIITGTGPAGLVSVTRTTAASAIVLAMKWDEDGVQNVQIAPPGKTARCFKIFRAQHYGWAPASKAYKFSLAPGRDAIPSSAGSDAAQLSVAPSPEGGISSASSPPARSI